MVEYHLMVGVKKNQLKDKKLYDFSDMILTVLEKLRKSEDFKFDLQEQYQYILW
jgi:superfamily I DNA/RNA helicase